MTAMDGVTLDEDRDTVSATAIVEAPAPAIFDLLRRPAVHERINGDGSVQGTWDGPAVIGPGSRFGMRMRLGLPYRVHSTVVEYEQDRVIAWHHFMGHRWTWRLEPADEQRSTVTETFDLSSAKAVFILRLMGYPGRHRDNVARSVANLRQLAETAPG